MDKRIKNESVKDKGVREVEIPKIIIDKKGPFRPDTNQRTTLVKAGRKGTIKAVRVSKALGLSMTFMENGVLYREFANGEKEIIKPKSKRVGQKVKKGIILHAR